VRFAVWLLVTAAACGRSGFDMRATDVDAPAVVDPTPEPVDWPDFTNVSSEQTLTGISEPITLRLSAFFGSGTPAIARRVNGGAWAGIVPGSPSLVDIVNGDRLQFRLTGNIADSATLTIENVSDGDLILDTVNGTVAATLAGDGLPGTPYSSTGPAPTSCSAFLAAFPQQAGADGLYSIDPGAPVDAYCDMTTDGGGWTLIARVLGTSTTHVTPGELGLLTAPTQATTAKWADAAINSIAFTKARFAIETVGTIYVNITSLNFSTTNYSLANTAAASLAGPYDRDFRTSTGCTADCGVNQASGGSFAFGNQCSYRYYSSAGNPRPGMGCIGNFGKPGAVWVR